MSKPIDDGSDKNLKTGFLRNMQAETLFKRFGIKRDGNGWLMNGQEMPPCPECGGPTFPKSVLVTSGIEVFHAQCISKPEDPNHGYSKFSKHGTRSAQGRKQGSQNRPKGESKEYFDNPKPTFSGPRPTSGKVAHPQIIRAAKYVLAGERNVYLTGPAGTGKSTGAEEIFRSMQAVENWKTATFHMLTVSMSTFASDLAGFIDRLNDGKYLETELVRQLQSPSLVVVDEADKGNPNLAGFWNTILANNKITTPGGTFERHPDSVILFIGNTTGHAPSKQYSGSVRQDFATLDRFRCFNIDFNTDVERAAIPGLTDELEKLAQRVRKNAETSGLQRIIGLRWLKRVSKAMEIEGKNAKDTMLQVMKDESWSQDEILASGIMDEEKKETAKATPGKIKYYKE